MLVVSDLIQYLAPVYSTLRRMEEGVRDGGERAREREPDIRSQ